MVKRRAVCLVWAMLVVALLPPSGLAAEAEVTSFTWQEVHLGGRVRLTVFAPDRATASAACRAAFDRVAAIEDLVSTRRPRSEVSQVNAAAGGKPVRVSQETFDLIARARAMGEESEGAFDPTIRPYLALWREARNSRQLPSPEARAAAGRLVDWRQIELDPDALTVRLATAGMSLDLGGIAKGYAGDQAVAVLASHGLTQVLFAADGDVVLGDPPPGDEGWTIQLFDDNSAPMTLANCGVSTSGDTEQYTEIDGVRYSHVVDPRTGLGVTSRILASVIAPDGTTADGWATALCILDEDGARALEARHPRIKTVLRVAR